MYFRNCKYLIYRALSIHTHIQILIYRYEWRSPADVDSWVINGRFLAFPRRVLYTVKLFVQNEDSPVSFHCWRTTSFLSLFKQWHRIYMYGKLYKKWDHFRANIFSEVIDHSSWTSLFFCLASLYSLIKYWCWYFDAILNGFCLMRRFFLCVSWILSNLMNIFVLKE